VRPLNKTAFFYDSRSLDSARMTGWERFSKELYAELVKLESPSHTLRKFNRGDSSTIGSLLKDLSVESFRNLKSVRHYPTIPPMVANQKTVFTVYDATWWKYPQYASKLGGTVLKRLSELTIKGGAKIVTISETAKTDIQDVFGLDSNQIEVVYPGLTALPLDTSPKHPNKSRPYLLFVGTLEPRKDLGTLLKAYEQSKLLGKVDLVVIGRIGWNTLPPSGVKYVGAATDKELANWLSFAEALVVPSIYEGFGLPIIEAFSLGCPVIASNIPVFQEVTGGLASFFEVGQPDSLQKQINLVLSSNPEKSKLIERSAKFNWGKTAAQYLSIYEKVSRGEN
jgi:glycosyltransferase involved in cell wall biosynthesis